MAINFDSFEEGTTSTIQSNDYVVGFDTAVTGGERKYTLSTIANAVSGIMNAQLDADIANATNVTVLSASLSAAPFNAKAWVIFNGRINPTTGFNQIEKAYNVSSVADRGTANYRVNFNSNTMSDVNYTVASTIWDVFPPTSGADNYAGGYMYLGSNAITPATTNYFEFFCIGQDGAGYDSPRISVVFFN